MIFSLIKLCEWWAYVSLASKCHIVSCFSWVGFFYLISKHQRDLKIVASKKHSSLFCRVIIGEGRTFTTLTILSSLKPQTDRKTYSFSFQLLIQKWILKLCPFSSIIWQNKAIVYVNDNFFQADLNLRVRDICEPTF